MKYKAFFILVSVYVSNFASVKCKLRTSQRQLTDTKYHSNSERLIVGHTENCPKWDSNPQYFSMQLMQRCYCFNHYRGEVLFRYTLNYIY